MGDEPVKWGSSGGETRLYRAQANSLGVANAGKTLFTITPEGDVILGKDITWTEAAEEFWKLVDKIRPGKLIRMDGP